MPAGKFVAGGCQCGCTIGSSSCPILTVGTGLTSGLYTDPATGISTHPTLVYHGAGASPVSSTSFTAVWVAGVRTSMDFQLDCGVVRALFPAPSGITAVVTLTAAHCGVGYAFDVAVTMAGTVYHFTLTM